MEMKVRRHVVGLALIRLAASCVTLTGFVQLYCGSMAFKFAVTPDILGTIHFVGAFWVGLYLLLPGIMGMLTKSWTDVTRGFILGFFGIILSFIGIILDGSAYSHYVTIKACAKTQYAISDLHELVTVGNSSYALAAQYCAFNNHQYDCVCSNDFMDEKLGPAPRCYVLSGTDSSSLKKSCEAILKEYPRLLEASFSTCIVCMTCIFVFTMFTFFALFFPNIYERDYYKAVVQDDDAAVIVELDDDDSDDINNNDDDDDDDDDDKIVTELTWNNLKYSESKGLSNPDPDAHSSF